MVVAASGSEKRIRISFAQEQALLPMTEVIFRICTQYRLTLKLGKCATHWLLCLTPKLVFENFGWGAIARWRPLVAGLLANMLSGQVT